MRMRETEPFFPIIDLNRCNGYGNCVQICPGGALEMNDGLATIVAPDHCVYCADCEEHCPHRAIGLPYEIVSDSSGL
jgi:NAD-dependent dihydropyrimidine dehydrogenase PreA subunit